VQYMPAGTGLANTDFAVFVTAIQTTRYAIRHAPPRHCVWMPYDGMTGWLYCAQVRLGRGGRVGLCLVVSARPVRPTHGEYLCVNMSVAGRSASTSWLWLQFGRINFCPQHLDTSADAFRNQLVRRYICAPRLLRLTATICSTLRCTSSGTPSVSLLRRGRFSVEPMLTARR
jgi:hypothetical protein